ncbi:MAG: hypothetical protein Q9194_003623 [Teloschistes cf. exilis]
MGSQTDLPSAHISLDPLPPPSLRERDHGSVGSMTSGPSRLLPSKASVSGRYVQEQYTQQHVRGLSQSTPFDQTSAPLASEVTASPDPGRSRSESVFSARFNAPDVAVPTRRALRDFSKIAAQYHEKERQRKHRLVEHLESRDKHKDVYDRLKEWINYRPSSWTQRLWWKLTRQWPTCPRPSHEELLGLAKHHFCPRSRLKVHVMDFKQNETIHYRIELGEIEKFWGEKDEDVDVRWIHAPLGLGPVHSTIEDMFLHQAPDGQDGREFVNIGRDGWPYPSIELLNFRSRIRFQEMRDVHAWLQHMHDLDRDLDRCSWENYEPSAENKGNTILDDLKWRATHLNITQDFNTLPDFWTQVRSDMPWQLTEGLAMSSYGPLDGLKPTLQDCDKQALRNHDFFGSAQLVRDPFRCFHRGDGEFILYELHIAYCANHVKGFLLTLSPMAGVNYIDRHFSRHLEDPISAIYENDDASAIAFALNEFKGQGTKNWHRRSVEWLVVYLLTEIGVTPHPDRQGYNAPSPDAAYQEVIQSLKRRRYDQFSRQNRQEPADLVKDHLICIDELTRIGILFRKRRKVFTSLLKDVENFETEDLAKGCEPDHADKPSMQAQVLAAIRRTSDQEEVYERLLIEANSSLNAVYELRSLQQNDFAIISNNQNRAIFVFATVTVIFLPMGTLTSYWGTNVADIRNTSWSQAHFWKICGAVAIAAVFLVALWALKHWWFRPATIALSRASSKHGKTKDMGAMV